MCTNNIINTQGAVPASSIRGNVNYSPEAAKPNNNGYTPPPLPTNIPATNPPDW
jgi:hypothetical protein